MLLSVLEQKYFEKTLLNSYNVQYYGKMYLGTNMKEMTFIFDTGSSVSIFELLYVSLVVLGSNSKL
jgi:Eukaryotic aspartyl protease